MDGSSGYAGAMQFILVKADGRRKRGILDRVVLVVCSVLVDFVVS